MKPPWAGDLGLKQKIQTNNKSTHLYTEKNDGVISILEKIQELYERKI